MNNSDTLKELIDLLNKYNYAILHSWQYIPEYLPSDLDIVISAKDLEILEKELINQEHIKIVNLFRHESSCYYFVLAKKDNKKIIYIPLDIALDYRRNGIIWLTADEMLKDRRFIKNLWVVSAEVEFKYLLIKKLLKGNISPSAAKRLKELINSLDEKAHSIAQELLGLKIGSLVVERLKTDDLENLNNEIPKLQKALKKQKLKKDWTNPIRYWIPEIFRIWERFRYPTGFFVVILGPDGVGKTTLIKNLNSELERVFRRGSSFHFKPGLFKRKNKISPVTNPHSKPSHSLIKSVAKLVYYLLEYNLGYWFNIRPLLVKSTLVLFDRYYDDILIDPKRYRYGGPLWLAKLFSKLIPQPDLWIVLDAPEEEILKRKQELPYQELKRQRNLYKKFPKYKSNVFIIDGTLAQEEVVFQASEIILNSLHKRYLSRRKIWFSDEKNDNIEWLKQIFEESSEKFPKETFYYLKLPDGRGFLLPTNSIKATLAALSLYKPQKVKSKLIKKLLKLMLNMHLGSLILPKIQLNIENVKEFLQKILKKEDLIIAISLGTPGPHRKPVLKIMDNTGNLLAFSKIGWNQQTKTLVRNESEILKFLSGFNLSFYIPYLKVYKDFDDKNLNIQVPPLKEKFQEASLKIDEKYLKVLIDLAFINFNYKKLQDTDFWKRIILRKKTIQSTYWKHTLDKFVKETLKVWDNIQVPLHFAHGDLTPWNVLNIEGTLYVYDWEYASKENIAGYDLFHFLFQVNSLIRKKSGIDLIKTVLEEAYEYFPQIYKEKISSSTEIIKNLFQLYLLDKFSFFADLDDFDTAHKLHLYLLWSYQL